MKPKWSEAPMWANWLAMDGDGAWFWFAEEPHIPSTLEEDTWYAPIGTRFSLCNQVSKSWRDTKEKRP